MVTPIFVVGANRSGTTWLGNLLCRHSKIVGVQAREHNGIHESVFFSHVMGHFGDLKDDSNFIEFVETFSSSDYYKLTSLDKEFLYQNCPRDYGECFRLIMDRFAGNYGADYWVEKSPAHTMYLDRILQHFPNSFIFGIERGVVGVMESALKKLRGNSIRSSNIKAKVRRLILYAIFNKNLRYYASKYSNVRIIKFSDLKQENKATLNKLMQILSLEYQNNLTQMQYPPNTSFKSNEGAGREEMLTSMERKLLPIFASVFDLFPREFLVNFYKIWRNCGSDSLPDWFWKIYKEEVMPNKNNN